ncbi:protein FAM221B-like isoform X2 [Hemitrygon akajei]|uniref:protein FAM221B-like isoform X2 n=1 Tax=Hemitrygon akajei TaxID=2704970 RepID=UPI003BF9D54E
MIAFLASGQVQLRNTSAMSSGQGSKAKGKKAGVVPKTKGNESIQATPHSDMNSRAGPSHALVPYQASQATQENTMLGPKGIYIGWRCPEYNWDCIRVGVKSKCFCGHPLAEHEHFTGTSEQVPCAVSGCQCQAFAFIPSRPEDVGEFWLRKRRNFNPSTWRAKCRCKHNHEEHKSTGSHKCNISGCTCSSFESNFLCAACDKHWEQHHTFFETERNRKEAGLPYGEAYLPFAEMPNLRNAVLSGNEKDDSAYQNITSGTGPYSRLGPSSNSAGPVLPSNENTGEF